MQSTVEACTLWCPQCRRTTQNAPLPLVASDEASIQAVTGSGPRGLHRKHYCLDCRAIWASVQVPRDYLNDLLAAREHIDELRRENAGLRFLLAQDRRREELLLRAA